MIAAQAKPTEVAFPSVKVGPDLLAGVRPGVRGLVVAVVVLIAVDVFAGWTYLASYFNYFHVPATGLELSAAEVLAQGLRTVLLPLTVITVAAVAPASRLRDAAIGVGAYLLFLALAALMTHWASPGAILVQLAAGIVAAAVVFGLRIGVGGNPRQRLIVGAAGLLLVISLPVSSGTLDAGQASAAHSTTLQLVTRSPLLPGATPSAGGQFTYGNYVLLRESDSRYWLFRIGDHYAYSIAKADVLSIRY